MFKSIFLILISIFAYQANFAQIIPYVQPDHSRSLGSADFDEEWLGHFAYVNSELTRVYKVNKKLELAVYSNKDEKFFHRSRITTMNSDNSFFGQAFAFEYLGTTFVLAYTYFHTSWDNPYEGNKWLRLYRAKDQSLKKWSEYKISTKASKDNKLKYYTCAYASDKYLYLLYDTEIEYRENNDKFIHHYHQILVDACTIDEGKIHVHKTYTFKNVVANQSAHPVAVEGFKHQDGHLRLIVSYSSEYNPDLINNGGGVVVLNLSNTTYKHLHTWSVGGMSSIRAFFGSLKGKQEAPGTNDVYRSNPMRIQIISNRYIQGQHTTYYYLRTYVIEGEKYKLIRNVPIAMHSKMYWTWQGYISQKVAMDACINLTSINTDDEDEENDAVEQSIWLFHSNKKGDMYANIFKSDIWIANPDKTVASADLMDEQKYGSSIRSLWTLVGITDGAPPIAIDWPKWDSANPSNIYPTTLDFVTTKQESSSVSQSYERGFYIQVKGKLTNVFDGFGVSASLSAKYASHQKNTTTTEKIVSTSLDLKFDQTETAQKHAYLIWVVPDIRRLEYAVYPWWDNKFEFPQDSSTLYKYITSSVSYHIESVPISQAPFNINNANADSLTDWMNRDSISSYAGGHPFNPVNISWSNGQTGTSETFFTEEIKTKSYTNTHSYSVDGSLGFKIPKVFSFDVNIGGSWEYTTECTTSSSISKEVKVTMENLHSINNGIKNSSISVNAYFFQHQDDANWWYYKDFGQHRPWYIAYEVITVSPIKVTQPYSNDVVRSAPVLSWTHKDQTDFDYTVEFSPSCVFERENTIEIPTAKEKSLVIPENIAKSFPEDSIIYWVVRGKNSKGKYSWSKVHWFIISQNKNFSQSEAGSGKALLDFIIFPNPIQNKQTHILIKSGLDTNPIHLEVYSLEGKLVYQKDIRSNMLVGSELKINLSMLSSGYYTLKLESASALGTGKIVIP